MEIEIVAEESTHVLVKKDDLKEIGKHLSFYQWSLMQLEIDFKTYAEKKLGDLARDVGQEADKAAVIISEILENKRELDE